MESSLKKELTIRKVARREFTLEELKNLYSSIVKALYYLHYEKSMTHRNLKPSNVLLSSGENIETSEVKISDISHLKFDSDPATMKSLPKKDECYLAPEIIETFENRT